MTLQRALLQLDIHDVMKFFWLTSFVVFLNANTSAFGNFTIFQLSGIIKTDGTLVYSDQDSFSARILYDRSQSGIIHADYVQYSGIGRFWYSDFGLVEDNSLEVRVYDDNKIRVGNPGIMGAGYPGIGGLSNIDLVSLHFSSNLFASDEIPSYADDGLVFVLRDDSGTIFSDNSLPDFSLIESLFDSGQSSLDATGQFHEAFNPLTGSLSTAFLHIDSIIEVSAVPESRQYPFILSVLSATLALFLRRRPGALR